MKRQQAMVSFSFKTRNGYVGHHIAVFNVRNGKLDSREIKSELRTIGFTDAVSVKIDEYKIQ